MNYLSKVWRDLDQSIWIEVKDPSKKYDELNVHIIPTNEGVMVDIYPAFDLDIEPITSTYAHFNERSNHEPLQ